MDILDLLESRIDSLLGEHAVLKAENVRLQARLDELEGAGQEKAALELALLEEKDTREQVLARIDALLKRLTAADNKE